MRVKVKQGTKFAANAQAGAGVVLRKALGDIFMVECFRLVGFMKWLYRLIGWIGKWILSAQAAALQRSIIANYGILKWRDTIKNLVVNAGLDDSLDKYFKGSGYTAAHYVGLADGTPTFAAADTMASHSGWVEVTAYDETVRQTATWGTVSGQSVDNSGSKAVFTISTNNTTIGGAFVVTDNTKGGSTGTLYGGGAFTAGDKILDDDDVLNVTVTATASAS